jgi:hypothetical protein
VRAWLHELDKSPKPSEHVMVQACTFAYRCARLCSRIKAGTLDVEYSSILQSLDETEKSWSSSCDDSSIVSVGVHAYQGNFQMRLSASVLASLRAGHEQHVHSATMQERCIETFRATATRVMHAMPQGTDHKFNLGWADAVMVYGALRTIAISPMSLGWQRNAAKRVLAMIQERLGFRIL